MHPLKIEVEPLSEQRWAKVEKGLFERLDREAAPSEVPLPAPRVERSWRWRPAVALVLAGAMAAAIGALVSRSFLQSPTPPAASSRIVTGAADSRVAVGESEVDVSPDSTVLVTGDDARGVLVVIDRGKVDCEVAPRKGRPPFVVQAGDVRVRVLGTHFTVARDTQFGGAHVSVSHGVVEVTSHGETVSVRAGEEWPPAPPPPAPTAENTPSAQAAPQAPAPVTSRTRAHHVPRTTSRRAPVVEAPVTQAPVDNPPVAPAVDNPPPAPPPAVAPAPPPAVAPPPAPPPPAAPAPPPGPSAQELYESANRMEAQNPDASIAIYRKLAAGSGPWAANALYAAARLQADRGRRADATRLLNDYLTRYPNGANARDARDLLDKMR